MLRIKPLLPESDNADVGKLYIDFIVYSSN